MPVYCYGCSDCDYRFETRHRMSFEGQSCLECDSENVFKIPSISTPRKDFRHQKPGKIVDEYIEDTKSIIKKEKKTMISEVL